MLAAISCSEQLAIVDGGEKRRSTKAHEITRNQVLLLPVRVISWIVLSRQTSAPYINVTLIN
jgi:hypothetical protein